MNEQHMNADRMHDAEIENELASVRAVLDPAVYRSTVDHAVRNMSVDVVTAMQRRRTPTRLTMTWLIAPAALAVVVVLLLRMGTSPSVPVTSVAVLPAALPTPAQPTVEPSRLQHEVKTVARVGGRRHGAPSKLVSVTEEQLVADLYTDHLVDSMASTVGEDLSIFELSSNDVNSLLNE